MTSMGLRPCSDSLDATVHDCGSVTIYLSKSFCRNPLRELRSKVVDGSERGGVFLMVFKVIHSLARSIQTTVDSVEVRVPQVWDRERAIRFTSAILPPTCL